jgi:hypothetical protein
MVKNIAFLYGHFLTISNVQKFIHISTLYRDMKDATNEPTDIQNKSVKTVKEIDSDFCMYENNLFIRYLMRILYLIRLSQINVFVKQSSVIF